MRRGSGAWLALGIFGTLLLAPGSADAQKKTLTIGLNQDPDILDPTLSRTYVGRIVYAHMCEKLYELDETLKIQSPSSRRTFRLRGRRQDGHDQAAGGREVQRRHAVRLRRP